MLRNSIVVAALAIGLFCIGVIVSADVSGHHISLRAPSFLASSALAGE